MGYTSFAAALPAAFRHMAADCDMAAVMSFIQWRGNTRYYVPQQAVADNHELVIKLGRKAADWLVANYGGETMVVPKGADMMRRQRDGEIRAFQGKKTAAEVARVYGITERHVWRIWAEGESLDTVDGTQGGLF
jgi:Mor family transcriptional regulator